MWLMAILLKSVYLKLSKACKVEGYRTGYVESHSRLRDPHEQRCGLKQALI